MFYFIAIVVAGILGYAFRGWIHRELIAIGERTTALAKAGDAKAAAIIQTVKSDL